MLRCVTEHQTGLLTTDWTLNFTLYTPPLQLLSRPTIFECTGNNWCVILWFLQVKVVEQCSPQAAQHTDAKQNKENKINKQANKKQLYLRHIIITKLYIYKHQTNYFVSDDQWYLYCRPGVKLQLLNNCSQQNKPENSKKLTVEHWCHALFRGNGLVHTHITSWLWLRILLGILLKVTY